MPYKKTGKPPGRPRKTKPVRAPQDPAGPPVSERRLERARKGFQRAFADPAAALYSPPRYGVRRRKEGVPGKRPILNPNVMAKL